jgi:hypothetical protein
VLGHYARKQHAPFRKALGLGALLACGGRDGNLRCNGIKLVAKFSEPEIFNPYDYDHSKRQHQQAEHNTENSSLIAYEPPDRSTHNGYPENKFAKKISLPKS